MKFISTLGWIAVAFRVSGGVARAGDISGVWRTIGPETVARVVARHERAGHAGADDFRLSSLGIKGGF